MSTRLYIGKIGNLTQAELESSISASGKIVDFLLKETYAFVEFASELDTKKALIDLDGRCINGQRIVAEYAKAKSGDTQYFNMHPRLYIGRLKNYNKQDIINLFGKYGDITDVLQKDDFAFVEYEKVDDANKAIQELNSKEINGQKIVVEEARPKEYDNLISTPRLYIGKIGSSIKKHDIVSAFGVYGEITDMLMKDDFAFIEFATITSATRALNEMNGAKIAGCKISVEEAKPKEGTDANGLTKRPPLQTNNMALNQASRINNQSIGITRIKVRRKSPRRSYSRSRSRSHDKK